MICVLTGLRISYDARLCDAIRRDMMYGAAAGRMQLVLMYDC